MTVTARLTVRSSAQVWEGGRRERSLGPHAAIHRVRSVRSAAGAMGARARVWIMGMGELPPLRSRKATPGAANVPGHCWSPAVPLVWPGLGFRFGALE